jgi:ribonuclease HII
VQTAFYLHKKSTIVVGMIGIDEVGRGCLAGPLLVVAACQTGVLPAGLADSKVLSRKQREDFMPILIKVCSFGEGWVKPSEIDKLGLTMATKLGVKRALRQLGSTHKDELLIDGNINYAPKSYKSVKVIIDGDALVPLISAASIYAKVKRDEYMRGLAGRHPNYGFGTNVGYGTKMHLAAIDTLGTIKHLHRQSFSPFKLLQENPV